MSEFRMYAAILILAVYATLQDSASCTHLSFSFTGNIVTEDIGKRLLAHEFTIAHNAVRLAYGLKPLNWNRTLAKYARRWANQRINDCALMHSPDSPYGENMFWSLKPHWTPAAAVKTWVDEKMYYNQETNECMGGHICGHFTQVIWKSSERFGCARVTCSFGKGFLYVCAYDPPGNIYFEGPFGGHFTKSVVNPPTR